MPGCLFCVYGSFGSGQACAPAHVGIPDTSGALLAQGNIRQLESNRFWSVGREKPEGFFRYFFSSLRATNCILVFTQYVVVERAVPFCWRLSLHVILGLVSLFLPLLSRASVKHISHR